MTKQAAINDAQEKANLSKKNQVVYKYIMGGDPAGWTVSTYDYTHETLWERGHFRAPITTKVTVVTPATLC